MDLTKAQRLINKIQAFLDNGNAQELSRLEKDLIKSYVQQLYEAVIQEESTGSQPTQKPTEASAHKNLKEDPIHKIEVSAPRITETPRSEPTKPVYPEYFPTVSKSEPVTTEYSDYSAPLVKEKPIEKDTPKPYKPITPAIETKPHHFPVAEAVKETLLSNRSEPTAMDPTDALNKLFELQKSDDAASRFGHVPIASIESAMGLNERIFTLNELFGGDKGLFDTWCSRLNGLQSFAEAKNVLITGPAKDFKWSDPVRIKMAEQFLRIVSRRYPKAAN